MIEFLLLAAGIILLVKGADYLIDGASSLGKAMHISSLTIGLTVLAFGTSIPELAINLFSSIKGTTDINLGNIIGSNIANILLILGLSTLFISIKVKEQVEKLGLPFLLFSVLLLLLVSNDAFFNGPSNLGRIDGIIFLILFGYFLYYLYSKFKIDREVIIKQLEVKDLKHKHSDLIIAAMILGGIIALYLGGKLVIDSSVIIARNFGLSEFLISATILAIGTSLPELIVTISSAARKKLDFVMGTIVGSNIFNTFMILGVSSIIRPIPFNNSFNFDLIFLLIITSMLIVFMYTGKKQQLERWNSILFLLLYVFYLTVIISRG